MKPIIKVFFSKSECPVYRLGGKVEGKVFITSSESINAKGWSDARCWHVECGFIM